MPKEVDKNKIKNGLYIVSTPIGNLEDITLRAISILNKSDFILCEDTRVSMKLLSKFKIKKKLISNHKFNENKNVNKIIELLKSNKIISLISDAGTPMISDPGRIILNNCIKNNINIFPIPGPSSPIAALSVSGFSDKYYFHGFLPEKISKIENDFKILSSYRFCVVFFISSKKLNKIIDLLKKYFFDRDIVICREITKFYEEFFRSNIQNLKKFESNIKGEVTIVISEEKKNINKLNILDESVKKKIKDLIKKKSVKDIVTLINMEKNISKKIIYNYCVRVKNEK